MLIKQQWEIFPGSPVVNTLASTVGGMHSILDQGAKIPHIM